MVSDDTCIGQNMHFSNNSKLISIYQIFGWGVCEGLVGVYGGWAELKQSSAIVSVQRWKAKYIPTPPAGLLLGKRIFICSRALADCVDSLTRLVTSISHCTTKRQKINNTYIPR
jgi:hypothetical protein